MTAEPLKLTVVEMSLLPRVPADLLSLSVTQGLFQLLEAWGSRTRAGGVKAFIWRMVFGRPSLSKGGRTELRVQRS